MDTQMMNIVDQPQTFEMSNIPSETVGDVHVEHPRMTARNVNVFYGDKCAIDDVTLDIAEKQVISFIGPSGCGKSTVTRLVAGLLKPDSGTVWLQGEKVTSPRATVGMAFQNPVLLEWRSILKNVMLPLEIVPNDLNQVARETRARDLLKLVGLAGFEDKRPSELSGGMHQRAAQ